MSFPTRDVAAGDLLISSVEQDGGIFDQSVLVLLDADENGSLGVILNKISEVPLSRVLPDWVDIASAPRALFDGGPVSPEGAICLAALADENDEPPGWRRVFGPVGLLHLDTPVEIVAGAYRDIRIFAGYAGWEAGQLRAELARGSWHLARARYPDVFSTTPTDLWRATLRRQPVPTAFYTTWTSEPELN